jgi:hypothetical protein
MKRERFIPSDYSVIKENADHKIVVYGNTEKLFAMAFMGTKSSREFHHKFKNTEQMTSYIDNWFDKEVKAKTEIAERKVAKKTANKELDLNKVLKLGDVVVSTWGWEQTNVDYFQIVEIKGKRVRLKAICGKVVEGSEGNMCCNVIPDKDNFLNRDSDDERWSLVKVNKYDERATKWS